MPPRNRAGWAGRLALAAALLAGVTDANGVAADTWGIPAVVNQDYSHEHVSSGPARPDEDGGRITFAAALEAWLRGGCFTPPDATLYLG